MPVRRLRGKDYEPFERRSSQADASIKKFTDSFKKRLQGASTATPAGMERATEIIADEAAKITPVDTGDLLSSQFTEVIVEKDKIIGVVGYDKEGNYAYGVFQHEIPYDHTESNNPQAEDKFLEKGFARGRAEAIKAIFDTVKTQWK